MIQLNIRSTPSGDELHFTVTLQKVRLDGEVWFSPYGLSTTSELSA